MAKTTPRMSDAVLAHGYTLGDVERFTRMAVARCRVRDGVPHEDRYDSAWHGVVEALYSATEAPPSQDLIAAGWQAIYDEVEKDRQAHGRSSRGEDVGPRFAKFWFGGGPSRFPDDAIVERLAAVQVLPMLSKDHCDALMALVAHEDVTSAAAAMGIPVGTMKSRLHYARETFRKWWHEDETPIVHRDRERTCGNGHDRETHGRVSEGGQFWCAKCRADYKRRRRAKGLAA